MESLSKWKNNLSFLIVVMLFATATAMTDDQPEVKFEKAEIEVGTKKIQVEIARTSVQQQKGLMYREALGADQGMLFIFDESSTLSFWMKNTFIDLSIAYIDKNKKIVDIQEMKATQRMSITEPPTYPSKKPARYALEMTKGWFKKNNIKVGHTLRLPKNLK